MFLTSYSWLISTVIHGYSLTSPLRNRAQLTDSGIPNEGLGLGFLKWLGPPNHRLLQSFFVANHSSGGFPNCLEKPHICCMPDEVDGRWSSVEHPISEGAMRRWGKIISLSFSTWCIDETPTSNHYLGMYHSFRINTIIFWWVIGYLILAHTHFEKPWLSTCRIFYNSLRMLMTINH